MDLPKGFHREVIEAKENHPVDFTERCLMNGPQKSAFK